MKKINVIIPAAGAARRLRPLTNSLPKSLLKINDQSIIAHQLKNLPSDKIEKVIIVLGHMDRKIKKHIYSLDLNFPIEYHYNAMYEKTNCAYSLMIAQNELSHGALLINCDLLFKKKNIIRLLESEHYNVATIREIKDYKTDLQKVKIVDTKITKWSLNLESANSEVMGPLKISTLAAKELINLYNLQSYDKQLKMHCFSLISKCINKIIFHSISINDNDWHEIDTIEDLENAKNFYI
ncbi:MAG: hypothetical protein CMG62_00085 [Candidatus Marinimicrobia bacterium]|nr:hypothetical protein [Candidatus Neomarinimicrobiota bacterium]